MGAVLVTPAASYAITLSEAKAHCRVSATDEDDLIESLIAAASEYVEKYTGRSILAQTWRLSLDCFKDEIILPYGPVQSVTTVAYYDGEGVDQTLATGWLLNNTVEPERIEREVDASWPSTQTRFDAVRITYVTGFATVPAPIKHAMLLLIGHWFEHREAVGDMMQELPMAVDALLANYRVHGF